MPSQVKCISCKKTAKNNPKLSFFRFPKEPKRCLTWLQRCGQEELQQYTPEYCYKQLRLCSDHFERRMFSSMQLNRLNISAVPTIFDKGPSLSKENPSTTLVKSSEDQSKDVVPVEQLLPKPTATPTIQFLQIPLPGGSRPRNPMSTISPRELNLGKTVESLSTNISGLQPQGKSKQQTSVDGIKNNFVENCNYSRANFLTTQVDLVPKAAKGARAITQLNGNNSCLSGSKGYLQPDQNHSSPLLYKLLQPEETVQSGIVIATNDKILQKNNKLDVTNRIFLDHDYAKKHEQEENKNDKRNVSLTINLTEYSKHLDVKNICGVVLMLKDNALPVSLHTDTNKKHLPVPSADINDAVSQNEVVKQEDFKCQHCSMVFYSKEVLRNHIKKHRNGVVLMLKDNALPVPLHIDTNKMHLPVPSVDIDDAVSQNKVVKQEDFKCEHCSMVFYFKHVLRNHIRRYHNIGFKYSCPECPKRYQSLVTLSNHIKRVHDYHCEFCKARFRLLAAYKEHIRENHKEVFYNHCKPYYCRACDIEFSSKDVFLKHLRDHGGCLCNICLEIFSTKDEYKAHQETHPNKYFCKLCNKGFKEKCSLKAHSEVHNSPYAFPCPQCSKTYKSKAALRVHVVSHNNPQKKFMCDKCSKMCRTKGQLKRHLKQVHDKIRNFQCTECNKKFFTGTYLKTHYNITHLKLKPYQCEICGKQFARKDFLLAHRTIHTKKTRERTKASKLTELLRKMIPKGSNQPLECLICRRTLKNVTTLKAHLNTHIRLRRFKCRHCGLMFLHQTSKIRHEKSHEADPEHKFICPVCWKRMETKETLEAHMDEHNRPKRHLCNVCGETFSRGLLLDNHILLKHTTEEEIVQKEQLLLEDLEQAVNI